MIKFFLLFFFILCSCGYPDIDTVPEFQNMKILKEEAIELCKINNSDNEQLTKCLDKLNYNIDLL